MDMHRMVLALLVLAVVVATARLLWFALRQTPDRRPRAWRIALFVVLQCASAFLLYRTLLPPPVASGIDALVVATGHARTDIARALAPHETLVALPEAPALAGAESIPDLGTALRRRPATARVRIVGDGLEARDRDHLHGLPLTFEPTPLPRGLIELWAPPQVQAGTDFQLRGRAHDARGGSVELIDPSGQRVDRQPLDTDGRFTLVGATRTAGLVKFQVRVSDARGQSMEVATVPLTIHSPATTNVLVLAGSPDAELKYLRRWAVDSGVRMTSQIQLGGGMQLGDAPVALNASTLKKFDAVIVDERTWDGLGDARRRVLVDAVHGGLGLLVRVTGPISATGRRTLGALGLRLDPATTPSTFALPVAEGGDEFVAARLGPGSHDAPTTTTVDIALPELTRPPLRIDAANAHAWLRDKDGRSLAAWRAVGQGRIGAWLPMDTFQLVLLGREDLHARLWSDAIAVVARPVGDAGLSVPHDARKGTRMTLCGLADGASVASATGRTSLLLIDPATGPARCAGFWPDAAGWHTLRSGNRSASFFVRNEHELAGVAAQSKRNATAELALDASNRISAKATVPGTRWPWFIAWLLASAALWWLERSRLGRRH